MKSVPLRSSLRTLRVAAAAAATSVLGWAYRAHAAIETGLETTGKEAGYEGSTEDVNVVVSGVISSVLGVTGVLFLILTIYAGVLWMTAQGSEEQVTKARKMLISSVIGMVIVFSSYAITRFLFEDVLSGL